MDNKNIVKDEPEKEEPEIKEEPKNFKKNIKFLWVYGTVFFLFVIVLISFSSIILSKRNSELEAYKNQVETQNQNIKNNSSALKNVQDENTFLKDENEKVKKENESVKKENSTVTKDAAKKTEISKNLEKLVYTQQLIIQRKMTKAREIYIQIKKEDLPESCISTYDYIGDLLGV